jgi:hypothetical protein
MEWIGFFTPLPGTTNRGWTRSSTESFVSRMSLRRFSLRLMRLGLYAGKNMAASNIGLFGLFGLGKGVSGLYPEP